AIPTIMFEVNVTIARRQFRSLFGKARQQLGVGVHQERNDTRRSSVMRGSVTESPDRRFWFVSLTVALILVAIVDGPVFLGKVPFPASKVFDFPPFAKAAPPSETSPVADVGDIVTSFYPYRTIAAHAVHEGRIPLWNPYMLSGAPFVANTQSAVFYPFTVL